MSHGGGRTIVKQSTLLAKGYSLIEMMFTVLIIAVILAYALYAYQDFTDKAKIQEAARLAYEIRQGIDAHVTAKREFPPPINRTYVNMEYVERAETQQDNDDTYRINVYFKRDAFPGSSTQRVFTLYGNLIDNQMDWQECDDACVKNPVDIPPAMPLPPSSNQGIVTTGGPTTPSINITEAYGKTQVVIKFKGGNAHDGAIRANVRATKLGEHVNKIGAKQYYGLEDYTLPGGEHPFSVVTAELEQYDSKKGAWVKVWSKNVKPAPRGRDVKYEFFETIPTKWKPNPDIPYVGPPTQITYPGDNWDGKGNPNPGGGDFLPDPPDPIYDWKTTHYFVSNDSMWIAKVYTQVQSRSTGKWSDNLKMGDSELTKYESTGFYVESGRGHENPVKKIKLIVKGYVAGSGWEAGIIHKLRHVKTIEFDPAGYENEKRICFTLKGDAYRTHRVSGPVKCNKDHGEYIFK